MRLKMALILLACLLFHGIARADAPAIHATTEIAPPAAETVYPQDEGIKNAATALAKKIDPLHWNGVPLNDAFKKLQEQSGVKLEIDWDALAEQKIKKDALITLDLPAATMREILQKILATINNKELRFGESLYPLVVSTHDGLMADKYEITRIYDLRPMFPPGTYQGQYISRSKEFDELLNSILQHIAPDTWRDNGGIVGSLRFLNGQMIVTQSADNMEEVRRLLLKIYERDVRYIRAYDVRDLLFGGIGRQSVDELEKTIKSQVSPDTWGPSESALSLMCEFDGWLYVTARKATHLKIEEKLEQIRK